MVECTVCECIHVTTSEHTGTMYMQKLYPGYQPVLVLWRPTGRLESLFSPFVCIISLAMETLTHTFGFMFSYVISSARLYFELLNLSQNLWNTVDKKTSFLWQSISRKFRLFIIQASVSDRMTSCTLAWSITIRHSIDTLGEKNRN